ncbi:hypothetical protein HYQ46_002872 [Verticillium longisporum]|nr:hypothetical protein HYQ46_002872 [Verticillium longisporum]
MWCRHVEGPTSSIVRLDVASQVRAGPSRDSWPCIVRTLISWADWFQREPAAGEDEKKQEARHTSSS